MKNLIQALFRIRPAVQSATRRETQVATHIAEGRSNKEIARLLDVSIKTVEKHRDKLYKKFGFKNSADVTRWACAKGICKNEWL
jgi:DNA-binding NarL/FixJ family response regulator